MLLVIGLMAFIFAIMIPGVSVSIRAAIQNSSRELASTVRAAYDEAVLKGRVFRIVFDLDKQQYWVEQGPQNLSLQTDEQREEEKRRDGRRTEDERKAVKKPVFGMAKDVTRDKRSLPSGVKFADVVTPQYKNGAKTGLAVAHVFPHGFMEKLVIHLKDTSDHSMTLVADPVSGKTRVLNGLVNE
jgi:type II secretory pathway pseudopilin PulG